jgi:hypothetical protein
VDKYQFSTFFLFPVYNEYVKSSMDKELNPIEIMQIDLRPSAAHHPSLVGAAAAIGNLTLLGATFISPSEQRTHLQFPSKPSQGHSTHESVETVPSFARTSLTDRLRLTCIPRLASLISMQQRGTYSRRRREYDSRRDERNDSRDLHDDGYGCLMMIDVLVRCSKAAGQVLFE